MSLFGTTPPDSASNGKDNPATPVRSKSTKHSSLFGDDDDGEGFGRESKLGSARKADSRNLFADDGFDSNNGLDSSNNNNHGGNDSPWDFPTPKKAAARGTLVRSLLSAAEVPKSYGEAYEAAAAVDVSAGEAGLSFETAKKLVHSVKNIGQDAHTKILEIVVPSGGGDSIIVARGEFNVLMALIGLAEEGEDITLDGVDDRRKNLPEPNIQSFLSSLPVQKKPEDVARPAPTPTPAQKSMSTPDTPSRTTMRTASFGLGDPDPWGSPALHKGHSHESAASAIPQSQRSTIQANSGLGGRTTSAFTTHSDAGSTTVSGNNGDRPPSGNSGDGWAGFGATGGAGDGFRDSGLGGGFNEQSSGGGRGEGNGNPGGIRRAIGGGNRVASHGAEEVITVTAISEKEGMFLFQHRNYEVTSARRNSKVIRRYSDFVWLLDCLHKRYPFRQLPLLPPKRVAINGNYIAADASFVEKRRRGLARFANALVRHPVLAQEQLVVMFLTVPTEIAVWRKQAAVAVQEEFTGKELPQDLEDSLPTDLEDLFERVRSGVRRSAEIYINLCNLTERLSKRNEGISADYMRYSVALSSLTEASADTYATDTNDVPLLNEGLMSTSKHFSANQALMEDEARAWEDGVLEDMKRQRDCLVSMRDLFDRRDRYAKDNIPQLERRIQNNENKLANIRGKPEGQQRPGEAEKVEDAIVRDKQSIVDQHARGVFIKECVRDELLFFQNSQYHVSRLHQDWSQERVKYSELQADNWRALSEEVETMPIGD